MDGLAGLLRLIEAIEHTREDSPRVVARSTGAPPPPGSPRPHLRLLEGQATGGSPARRGSRRLRLIEQPDEDC